MTRTHTVYFGEEALSDVLGALGRLQADWDARRQYMRPEAASAGDTRLTLALVAVTLLAEPVAESLT